MMIISKLSRVLTVLLVLLCIYSYDLNDALAEIYDNETLAYQVPAGALGPLLSFDNKARALHFKCSDLFQSLANSPKQQIWPSPRIIPFDLVNAFTLNGLIPRKTFYFNEQHGGAFQNSLSTTWSIEFLQIWMKKPNTCNKYYLNVCAEMMEKYKQFFPNKRGLVFGSIDPWAEAAFLKAGASFITTVEYSAINETHPQLEVLSPPELGERYKRGVAPAVDFIFSFSSFEHDGLGRYGDPLSPFADLESLSRAYCLLSPGGLFFLGLPSGPDALAFNAHRIYGKFRTHFFLGGGWKVRDLLGGQWGLGEGSRERRWQFHNQPIWVLEKREGWGQG